MLELREKKFDLHPNTTASISFVGTCSGVTTVEELDFSKLKRVLRNWIRTGNGHSPVCGCPAGMVRQRAKKVFI